MKTLLASFIFFTRLPFWRLAKVPPEAFRRVVEWWPVVGLLTGAITASALWLLAHLLPFPLAVIGAFAARILVTGALHEDGLADFFDGFGGGTTRERILAIMKDSHTGTYGVVGLLFYFLLAIGSVSALPLHMACMVVFAADPWSKWCASLTVKFLPYCRKETEAKSGVIYLGISVWKLILTGIISLAPSFLLPLPWVPVWLASPVCVAILIWLMHHKIQGYTGDCCGAAFLLCELAYFLTATVVYR